MLKAKVLILWQSFSHTEDNGRTTKRSPGVATALDGLQGPRPSLRNFIYIPSGVRFNAELKTPGSKASIPSETKCNLQKKLTVYLSSPTKVLQTSLFSSHDTLKFL